MRSRIYHCYLFSYIYDLLKSFFIQMHCIFIDLIFLLSCVLREPLARMIGATPTHVLTLMN